jgi:hypothetical protein
MRGVDLMNNRMTLILFPSKADDRDVHLMHEAEYTREFTREGNASPRCSNHITSCNGDELSGDGTMKLLTKARLKQELPNNRVLSLKEI